MLDRREGSWGEDAPVPAGWLSRWDPAHGRCGTTRYRGDVEVAAAGAPVSSDGRSALRYEGGEGARA